jgi:hypothetical protein
MCSAKIVPCPRCVSSTSEAILVQSITAQRPTKLQGSVAPKGAVVFNAVLIRASRLALLSPLMAPASIARATLLQEVRRRKAIRCIVLLR